MMPGMLADKFGLFHPQPPRLTYINAVGASGRAKAAPVPLEQASANYDRTALPRGSKNTILVINEIDLVDRQAAAFAPNACSIVVRHFRSCKRKIGDRDVVTSDHKNPSPCTSEISDHNS